MKRLLLILTVIILMPPLAQARVGVLMSELDNNPDKLFAYELEFPDGSLTCSGGTCTYAPVGGVHDAVTLGADADVLLGLTTQQIDLDSQTANTVFAGPAAGGAVDPTFRALVDADIPAAIARDTEIDTDISTHAGLADPHTVYMLESNIGTGASNYLQLSGTPGAPDGTKFLRDDLTWSAPGGSGDVTGVGDCASGACLDGSSDGGTYIRLYDGNSHYTQFAAGDSAGNLTFTFPTAAPGANDAILVMSTAGVISTVAATTYQPLDAYLTDIAALTSSQGDVFYFDGTDWVGLGPGTNGQFLMTQGVGANPAWGDPAGSGDITAVGDSASGAAFTADGTGNVLYFEGTTGNTFEIALTGANPGADVIVTIPASTGTLLLADGDGSSLTAVDAATGDSATAFFDAGTIEHEYGGLEADVSAYAGLVKITGGATSAVTVTAFAESILDDADEATFKGTVNLEIGTDVLAQQTIGIADNNLLEVDHAAATDNDYAKFTVNGLEGRSYAEVLSDIGAEAVDVEILRADTADTISADFEWQDNVASSYGNDNDWELTYDTDISDNDSDFTTALTGEGLVFETANAAADAKVIFNNSDATYGVTLYVENIIYSGSIEFDGSGDSYITLANNASLVGSGYQIFFEGGNLISVENGTEKELLNAADGATLTGTTWDYSSVTNFVLPTAAADASGEISISAGNQLTWHDGTKVVVIDTTVTTDNYVLKYDNATATFNLEADETGGTPAWSSVNDPAADTTIDHDAGEETSFTYTGNYTTGAQFLVQQLTGNPSGGVLFEVRGADSDSTVMEVGDGTNVWAISTAGLLANAGTATLNLAAASDLTIGGGQIDFDDMAGSGAITTTGAVNLGGAASLEVFNGTSDVALANAGEMHFNTTDEQISFHSAADGEISGEAALSLLEHVVIQFDPEWMYDNTTAQLVPILTVGDEAPEGIVLVEWSCAYINGDPTTELDADFMTDTDWDDAAGGTILDVIDTTTGTSSADTGFDSTAIANGNTLYLRFGADPVDTGELIIFEFWYYTNED